MKNLTPKCKNCWDKGYATVMTSLTARQDFHGDRGFEVPPHVQIRYCRCAKGKRMEKKARKEAA